MPRIRTIKPEFFMNDRLAELSPLHRLVFIGLWTIADKDGRLEDRPKRIKAEIFPWDKGEPDVILADLDLDGSIQRYEVDGERYIAIPGFRKHQRPHPKEPISVLPEPPSREKKRQAVERNGEPGKGDPFLGRSLGRSLGREGKESVAQAPPPGPADQVFEHWRQKLKPKAHVFDTKTRDAVNERLAEGFTLEDLCQAIDGCASNPHNQGDNDRHKKFDDLELICRSAPNVRRFQGYLEKPAVAFKPGGYQRAEQFDHGDGPHVVDLTDESKYGPMPPDLGRKGREILAREAAEREEAKAQAKA